MTLVFRNRLDPDNGRPILPPTAPVQLLDTVAEIKAALLVPGSYTVAPGTYAAAFAANTAGVSIACQPGVVFNSSDGFAAPWTIMASNFSLTGDWQLNASANIGMNIGDNTATLQSQQPDTVVIEGGTMTCGPSGALRAVACHGSNVTFQNVRFEGFQRPTQEAQAIWINNTNGPISILDCFIEAAGENLLSGGDSVNIPNAVPSDVHIARCTFYKRPSWRPPFNVTVKNNLEVKNGQRWLIEDCVMDGAWADGQSGNMFVLTVRDSGQALHPSTPALWNPWVICDAITIRHCIARNNFEPGSFAVSILGHDDGGRSSQQTRTITITNNLFEDCSNGIQINSGVTDLLLVDHNTFAGGVTAELMQFVNSGTLTTLQMTKNAGNQGAYGVFVSGIAAGNITTNLNAACGAGNWTCTGNILGRNQTQNVTWPAGNTVIGPASTPLALTPPPVCALTGAQAGADAGWDTNPSGIGINGDGTSTGGAP